MIYIGVSGFSYEEWKGSVYPKELSKGEYLRVYSSLFSTTEINYTFYRFPSIKTSAKWASQVPSHFRFSLKLNRRVTHHKKLSHCDEEMGWFLRGINPLGPLLGCVLVQLPPWFKRDLRVLDGFLCKFSQRLPLAFEFRHVSWFSPEVTELLRNHNVSLAIVESDKLQAVKSEIDVFVYVRLRKLDYCNQQIEKWATWIRIQKSNVFVYFKHGSTAPVQAQALIQRLQFKGKK